MQGNKSKLEIQSKKNDKPILNFDPADQSSVFVNKVGPSKS